MTSSRLKKLAALTHGAAVIGAGVLVAACSKSEPAQQPAANAPASVTADPGDPTGPNAAGGDAAAVPVRRIPIPNAMPPRFLGDGGQ